MVNKQNSDPQSEPQKGFKIERRGWHTVVQVLPNGHARVIATKRPLQQK